MRQWQSAHEAVWERHRGSGGGCEAPLARSRPIAGENLYMFVRHLQNDVASRLPGTNTLPVYGIERCLSVCGLLRQGRFLMRWSAMCHCWSVWNPCVRRPSPGR